MFPKEWLCGRKPPSAGVRWLVWISLPDEHRWEGDDRPGTSSASQLPPDAHSVGWEPDRRAVQNLPYPNGPCCTISTSRVKSQLDTPKLCVTPKCMQLSKDVTAH